MEAHFCWLYYIPSCVVLFTPPAGLSYTDCTKFSANVRYVKRAATDG